MERTAMGKSPMEPQFLPSLKWEHYNPKVKVVTEVTKLNPSTMITRPSLHSAEVRCSLNPYMVVLSPPWICGVKIFLYIEPKMLCLPLKPLRMHAVWSSSR